MEADYWHQKWTKNDIPFHNAEAHPLLVKHFGALGLAAGSRVFVPLCGKTRDIAWLLSQGHRVAGAELSRLAVEQLFEELGVVPETAQAGAVEHFSAEGIDVFVGDIFGLSGELLGAVDAVYDRAALVALPEPVRRRYSAHVAEITGGARQLLICFEYDQTAQPGPPFAIPAEEVAAHYGESHGVSLLERAALAGGLKGICPADEVVWRVGR